MIATNNEEYAEKSTPDFSTNPWYKGLNKNPRLNRIIDRLIEREKKDKNISNRSVFPPIPPPPIFQEISPPIFQEISNFTEVNERKESIKRKLSNSSNTQCNEKPVKKIKTEFDMVVLGSNGTQITTKAASLLNWDNPAACVRALLKILFSRNTLGTNTLTGNPSPAFTDKPRKGKLNEAIVQDITSYCLERCKHCTKSFVRNQITLKCAEVARRLRVIDTKENTSPKTNTTSDSSVIVTVSSNIEMHNYCMKMDIEEDKLADPITEKDKYTLGRHGTKVSRTALEAINWTVPNKAIGRLLMLVFSRETLATRTLSGKASPAVKTEYVKKALDENMVADIIQYCKENKNIPVQIIRQKITMKCADECKMKVMREKGKQQNLQNKSKDNDFDDNDDEDEF